jgi:TonB family protein
MRLLLLPTLFLLPAMAVAQSSHSADTPSSNPATTLQAKATLPPSLRAMPAAAAHAVAEAPAAAPAPTVSDVMVDVHQNVIERQFEDNDSTLAVTFGEASRTEPKLIQSAPLVISLREMEAEADETKVELNLTVNMQGVPQNVTVTHSGGAALDKRAIAAVSQYRFKPATRNNLAVEAPLTIQIKLKKS